MSDSSEIDAALSAKLLADATLMSYATDGVYFDEAAALKTKFVIVSLVIEFDEQEFGARSFEDGTYLVKYVEFGMNGLNAKAAAARIDALLDGKTLTINGYTLMNMQRIERVRYTEVDQIDPSLRWQHRGGRYQLRASL